MGGVKPTPNFSFYTTIRSEKALVYHQESGPSSGLSSTFFSISSNQISQTVRRDRTCFSALQSCKASSSSDWVGSFCMNRLMPDISNNSWLGQIWNTKALFVVFLYFYFKFSPSPDFLTFFFHIFTLCLTPKKKKVRKEDAETCISV